MKQFLENVKSLDMEKCVIIFPLFGHENFEKKEYEMKRLCDTARLECVKTFSQVIKQISPKFIIGEGKVQEVAKFIEENKIDVVIVDYKLSGSQTKNLCDSLNVKVIDRVTLILDIFAQNANSNDGKIEVKLAQDKYALNRLSSMQFKDGRFGGVGVGMRGPGETKIELDKRKLNEEILSLENEIKKIKKNRKINREKQKSNVVKKVVIVGYTNAGKSTLLNKLVKENILAKDKLFATLDTTSRRLYLEDGKSCVITDTVGFIADLPHELVESFASTMEEIQNADLILHVVDFADKYADENIKITENILDDMKVTKNRMIVFNKCDNLQHVKIDDDKIYLSAKNNIGIRELKEKIGSKLF